MKRYLLIALGFFVGSALLDAKPFVNLPDAIAAAKKVDKLIFVYVYDDI